ncbi:MAG: phage portal protein [Melioribacteraceae bacterium]
MKIKDNIAQKFGYVPSVVVTDLKNESEKVNNHLVELEKSFESLHSALSTLQSERSFAAAQVSNITSDWNDIYDTISASQNKGLVRLRNRSRQLAQNDPWAKKYLFMLQKNVVGADGFILRNSAYDLVYDELEKMKVKRFDKLANTIIQEMFDDWSLPENCDVTGQSSFRELCNIIIKQIPTDGEILIRPIRDKNYKYGYALQLIEADYLDETYSTMLPNGNMIVMGVEMTPYRKPVAYWLKKVNPYQQLMYGSYISGERIRISAYDENGLAQIKHLFVKESSAQVRGIPWFAPVAIRSKMLGGYEEAILVDARVSANKNVIYEYKDGSVGDEINQANIPGAEFAVNADGTKDPSRLIVSSMPGENVIVPKGMTTKLADFKSPSGKEGDFQKWALRGIASGLDVSFIALANDYEAVNYTSSRTNLLEERDTWKSLHSWKRDHFLNWNFAELLKMALLTQAINLPPGKFDKFNKPWFQGRAWKWVSPKDEAEAILLMLSNEAWLFDEFLAENGWSLEEFIDKKKAEKKAFADAGLNFPGSNYKQIAPIQKSVDGSVDQPAAVNSGNGKQKVL